MSLLGLGIFCLLSLAPGQLRILSPESLISVIDSRHFESLVANDGYVLGATATFGTPEYGTRKVGRLVYSSSPSLHCVNDYNIPGQSVDSSGMKADEGRSSIWGARRDTFNIVVVDRGECTFVKKAQIAQDFKNAHAVVIVQSEAKVNEGQMVSNVIPADDGYGENVRIPVLLIDRPDGLSIVEQILEFNRENSGLEASQENFVMGVLAWDMPSQSVVQIDLWTSSAFSEQNLLLSKLAPFLKEMKSSVKLIPHYNVHPLEFTDYNEMCLDKDKHLYCTEDIDGAGYITGRMIVEEDFRQLCIRHTHSEDISSGGETFKYSQKYLEYMERFATECPTLAKRPKKEVDLVSDSAKFGPKCSERVMRSVGVDVEEVSKCTSDPELKLRILGEEQQTLAWSTTAVRINGYRYAGDNSYPSVLRAVCSAFMSEPTQCGTYLGEGFAGNLNVLTGVSWSAFTWTLVLMSLCFCGAMVVYKRYMQRTMQAQLREEVMLEVKCQMAEYTPLQNA